MALIDIATSSPSEIGAHLGLPVTADDLASTLYSLLSADEDSYELPEFRRYESRTRTVTLKRQLGSLSWTEQRVVRTVHLL